MRREDIQMLRDIQKNAELGMKAVDTAADKVYDDGLALQISRQSLKYSELRNRAADRLLAAHLEPARSNVVEGALVAGGIYGETLFDTSTSHIAEVINCASRCINMKMPVMLRLRLHRNLWILRRTISGSFVNFFKLCRKFLPQRNERYIILSEKIIRVYNYKGGYYHVIR